MLTFQAVSYCLLQGSILLNFAEQQSAWRQILTYKDGRRAEKVKMPFWMRIGCSNEFTIILSGPPTIQYNVFVIIDCTF